MIDRVRNLKKNLYLIFIFRYLYIYFNKYLISFVCVSVRLPENFGEILQCCGYSLNILKGHATGKRHTTKQLKPNYSEI
jgi:hypothetical protein